MGIELTALRDVDAAAVTAAERLLATLISAHAPDVDVTGVLRSLVIRPHALLYSAARTEIDRLRRGSSFVTLAQDPELASVDVVDRLMSNYMIQRRMGTRASVMLTVTLSAASTVAIPSSTVFSCAGFTYRPAVDYVAINAAGDGGTRLSFTASPTGVGYWVQLQVIADSVGVREVDAGAAFSTSGLPGFLSAVAASAAVGGSDMESNSDLMARALSSIAPTVLATPHGLERLLRQYNPGILALRVVRYGDPELARNRYNMFSMATPGVADVYVRTSVAPELNSITCRGMVRVTREMLSATTRSDSLDVRAEVTGYLNAGAYEVVGVYPVASASDEQVAALLDRYEQGLTYAPHTHIRNVASAAGSAFVPTAADAAFSAVQGTLYAVATLPLTAVEAVDSVAARRYTAWEDFWRSWYVLYSADATEPERLAAQASMAAAQLRLGGGSVSSEFTAELTLTALVSGLPGLAELQAVVTHPDNRAPVDYLVRAYHPCRVGVSLRVLYFGAADQVDADACVAAVLRAVRGSGYDASRGVRVADIAAEVNAALGTSGVLDMPVTLTASLRLPTDAVEVWQSTTELTIPRTDAYAGVGVSPETTAFFIRGDDVELTVEAAR